MCKEWYKNYITLICCLDKVQIKRYCEEHFHSGYRLQQGVSLGVHTQCLANLQVILTRVVAEVVVERAHVRHSTFCVSLTRLRGHTQVLPTRSIRAAERAVHLGIAYQLIGAVLFWTTALRTVTVLATKGNTLNTYTYNTNKILCYHVDPSVCSSSS